MNNADVLYPSMRYSRREHCIAVMELARRWASRLTTDERLIDLIALVGLYHDVGHVALSHSIDQYLQQHADIPDHESRSAHTLLRVNTRLGNILSTWEARFVCDAITGRTREDTRIPLWAYHIVHQPDRSLPDVDRIVYLCHDSHKLGFPSGIDVDWITECLYIDDQSGSLAFSHMCQPSLQHIVDLRCTLFSDVFEHTTVAAYQAFLVSRFCDLYTADQLVALFRDFAWLELTDVLLWSVLNRDAKTMRMLVERTYLLQ